MPSPDRNYAGIVPEIASPVSRHPKWPLDACFEPTSGRS